MNHSGESSVHPRVTGVVELAHGSGGRRMHELLERIFYRHLDNPWLRRQDDQACFPVSSGRMVMTTDSHVVTPLFFPGGDIGSLAVHGTVNDIAMAGARPLYLSAGFILEEGFPLEDLERIVASMGMAARDAGVAVITGDTKVVRRGQADGCYINTSGIGVVADAIDISGSRARVGDKVIVSGTLGEHGIAIMASRENLDFVGDIVSDSAALHTLVARMLEVCTDIHCLRDPTRGGLSAVLNELCQQSRVGILLDEQHIPVREPVRAVCELLGLDALNIACEGRLVAIVPSLHASTIVDAMRSHPLGCDAAIIGEVVEDPRQLVFMRTTMGGIRLVDWLSSDPLPRIC